MRRRRRFVHLGVDHTGDDDVDNDGSGNGRGDDGSPDDGAAAPRRSQRRSPSAAPIRRRSTRTDRCATSSSPTSSAAASASQRRHVCSSTSTSPTPRWSPVTPTRCCPRSRRATSMPIAWQRLAMSPQLMEGHDRRARRRPVRRRRCARAARSDGARAAARATTAVPPRSSAHRRAHYAAMAAKSTAGVGEAIWRGVRPGLRRARSVSIRSTAGRRRTARHARVSAQLWRWPIPESMSALAALARRGVPMGVVSQRHGPDRGELLRSEICQVGDGIGVADALRDRQPRRRRRQARPGDLRPRASRTSPSSTATASPTSATRSRWTSAVRPRPGSTRSSRPLRRPPRRRLRRGSSRSTT